MALPNRSKTTRDTHAAYAASQPLFDVLRTATSRVTEQKAHLTQARNTVQTLHVKLVNTNNLDDIARHDHYIDCVVKAWRVATATYSSIFDELANVTAADASEGREAGRRYEEFKAMAESATAARNLAASFRLSGGSPQPAPAIGKRSRSERDEDGETSSSEDESEDDANASQSPNARPGVPKPAEANTGNQSAKKAGDEAPQPKTASANPDPEEGKKAWYAQKSRQKRERKRARKNGPPAPTPTQNTQPPPDPGHDPVPAEPAHQPAAVNGAGKENHTPIPGVEYDDVTAEVEARLKAKAERKRAKKSEKKRKRESGDSLIEAKPAAAEGAAKPRRKKARGEEIGGGVGVDGVGADAGTGRVKRAGEDGEQAEGGRKRRKGRV